MRRYSKTETIFFINCLLIIAQCTKTHHKSSSMLIWQIIYIIVGILLFVVAALIYHNRNNLQNMQEMLRRYLSTVQGEITFISIHKNSHRGEGMEEAIGSQMEMQKSVTLEEDTVYMERDAQLSIDSEENNNSKHLGSVFEQKDSLKRKKSKTRKRLADSAKISVKQQVETQATDDL